MDERTPMPAELGAQLRQARRAGGLGLRALGARTGASYPHLAAIERGKRAPGAGVSEAIIGALGLDPHTAGELRQVAGAVEDVGERRAAEREFRLAGGFDPVRPARHARQGAAERREAVGAAEHPFSTA